MFCTKCGKEMPEDNAFCPFCGQAQSEQTGTAVPAQTQRSAPGELHILPKPYGGLTIGGYFIYLDGVLYQTANHKNGITVKVTPGTHTVIVTDTTLSNDKLNAAGKAISNASSFLGNWGSVFGGVVELGTKASTAIKGNKGTAQMTVTVGSDERVSLCVTPKRGLMFNSFYIEETERK